MQTEKKIFKTQSGLKGMGSSMLTMLHRMDTDPLRRWAAQTGVGGLFTQMDRQQKSGRKKEGEHGSWGIIGIGG